MDFVPVTVPRLSIRRNCTLPCGWREVRQPCEVHERHPSRAQTPSGRTASSRGRWFRVYRVSAGRLHGRSQCLSRARCGCRGGVRLPEGRARGGTSPASAGCRPRPARGSGNSRSSRRGPALPGRPGRRVRPPRSRRSRRCIGSRGGVRRRTGALAAGSAPGRCAGGGDTPEPKKPFTVVGDGFSLNCAGVCEAHERANLERLCRYMARVPIAEERLSFDGDGLVVLELKRVFRDGTTHVLPEPEDVIARLAAAVPRPGAHLVRDHGLFAPRAPPPPPHRHAPQRADRAARQRAGPQSDRTAPMSWMARLRCGWVIDLSRCPQCGATFASSPPSPSQP